MTHRDALYYGDVTGSASDVTGAPTLDDAFLRRAQIVVKTASPHLQRTPSAAASPILRALLWQQSEAVAPKDEPVKFDLTSSSIAAAATTKADSVSTNAAMGLAAQALARRGVLGHQKDPALARLAKKRAAQSSQERNPQHVSVQVAASSTAKPLSGPLPWTRRRLSQMSETSWKLLREHIGVSVEVVQHTARSADGHADTDHLAHRRTHEATSSLHALFTRYGAPIRCWEEAGLPYALGKSITQRYTLPTAVQCQCVPLITPPIERGFERSEAAGRTSTPPSPAPAPTAVPPLPMHGFDVLAVADTGSGKTASYLVPLLTQLTRDRPRLLGHEDRIALGPQALVLVPTRELAEQVLAEVQALLQCPVSPSSLVVDAAASDVLRQWHAEGQKTHRTGVAMDKRGEGEHVPAQHADDADVNALCELRVVKLVGGDDRDAQYNALAHGAHLVIGTVGQLFSMLEDRLVSLGNTTTVVMDEADRMLDEHVKDSLVTVLAQCPKQRQTLLFTATLSEPCAALARSYLSPHGYLCLRISSGCASIRQSFEVFPTRVLRPAPAAAAAKDDPTKSQADAARKRGRGRGAEVSASAAWTRPMDPRVHPEKFARLVTWLVYTGAHGRVVVFANTKATCDVLQEELEKEATYLQEQADAQSLELLIGDRPAGLFFHESNDNRCDRAHTDRVLSGNDGDLMPGSTHGQLCLGNLTSTAVVHAGLSRAERERLVKAFRAGQRRVLLTTDLLARGLDVKGVSLVVSYDVPHTYDLAARSPQATSRALSSSETESTSAAQTTRLVEDDEKAVLQYEHRIGRTGRAGATGVAVSFLCVPERWLTRAAQARAAAAKARRTGEPASFQWGADDDDDGERDEEGSDAEETDRDWGKGADHDGTDASNNDSTAPHARGRRLESGAVAGAVGTAGIGPVYLTFPSDVPFLAPLWRFLLHCAEVNFTLQPRAVLSRTPALPSASSSPQPPHASDEVWQDVGEKETDKDSPSLDRAELIGKGGTGTKYALEAVLHANRYAKVHLDDVLAELLFQLTRSGRHGALTK